MTFPKVCGAVALLVLSFWHSVHAQSSTTLHVVLVKFTDHHPHGYNSSGVRGDNAYKFNDFKLMLGADDAVGSYDELSTVTLSNGEVLPKVYGSLTDWLDEMSGGTYDLDINIVNPPDAPGSEYPEWLVASRTREEYLDQVIDPAAVTPTMMYSTFLRDAVAKLHMTLPSVMSQRCAHKVS